MQECTKFVLGILVAVGLSGMANVFAADTKNLFGMDCEVTRIYAPGKADKVIFSTGEYQDQLAALAPKGYTRIDLIKEYNFSGQLIKVLFGEKCDHDIVRINGQEAINDLGIDHIKRIGDVLQLYGAKNNQATMITCRLSSLSGNLYSPFESGANFTKKTDSSFQKNNQSGSVQTSGEFTIVVPASLTNASISMIINSLGGNRKTDKYRLAQQLGISNYRGTKSQNMQIRSYLLAHGLPKVHATTTPEIVVSPEVYTHAQTDIVFNISKLRNYRWKIDRRGLAAENNILTGYYGSRSQNLIIRKFLLGKIKIK